MDLKFIFYWNSHPDSLDRKTLKNAVGMGSFPKRLKALQSAKREKKTRLLPQGVK